MEGIRLATKEEVEAINDRSDLGPTSTVIALDIQKKEPILAVIRTATELNPVFYGEASDRQKAMFIWGVENIMRFQGTPFYYFNIHADNETFRKFAKENMQAEEVSTAAEFRYKKLLNEFKH